MYNDRPAQNVGGSDNSFRSSLQQVPGKFKDEVYHAVKRVKIHLNLDRISIEMYNLIKVKPQPDAVLFEETPVGSILFISYGE